MNDLENYVLFGTLKVKDNKKIIKKENCVFSINDKYYKKNEIIEIVNYKKVGLKNKTNAFTEVKANDEKRNNLTGAYE